MINKIISKLFYLPIGAYTTKVTNMLFIFRQPIPAKRFEFDLQSLTGIHIEPSDFIIKNIPYAPCQLENPYICFKLLLNIAIMEKKSTFWQSAMTYGLYLGIALVLFNVILYVLGQNLNPALRWITYVLITAGIFYSQLNYRNRELNGYIQYSTALGFGVAVMLFAGIIQSLYTVILYKFIDPTILDQIRMIQEEAMLQKGLPEESIETATDMIAKFQSPVLMAISGLFSFALLGFIISLITSIFVKKNDEGNAFDEVMEEVKKEE
jgi:hypothetical protein